MTNRAADQAIEAALSSGRALLKVISPNDVGTTGSHQAGFWLPKSEWEFFSPTEPTAGINFKHPIRITWQDGRATDSVVTWYGQKTRREFRLTRFGPGFPFRSAESLGGLLVLVEQQPRESYLAFVLDTESEIEEIQAALGVELLRSSVLYDAGAPRDSGGIDRCLENRFLEAVGGLNAFPTTLEMADIARHILNHCVRGFEAQSADARLMRAVETEYRLFQRLERQLHEPEITRGFQSVDDFLRKAQSLLQRRKSRAGKSLEHHICHLIGSRQLPFEAQAQVDGTSIDVLIPGIAEYRNKSYPEHRLLALAVKTTCKDRWRQVTREAPRAAWKHLLTIQRGISDAQVTEMQQARVQLVVPSELHSEYSKFAQRQLWSVERFLSEAAFLQGC